MSTTPASPTSTECGVAFTKILLALCMARQGGASAAWSRYVKSRRYVSVDPRSLPKARSGGRAQGLAVAVAGSRGAPSTVGGLVPVGVRFPVEDEPAPQELADVRSGTPSFS